MDVITHIVPQLPPAICGVGDYCTLVGSKIQELQPQVQCGYVSCGCPATEQPAERFGRRNATGCCSPSRLWQAVEEIVNELHEGTGGLQLVVHYSGYGYDRGGAPGWLADALSRIPPRFSGARVVSMFHELYATGWPWQRAFWNSSRQRSVAIRIARLSDAVATNVEQSARWLEQVTGRAVGSIPSLPVPSNIGEPREILPWDQRAPQAVAFGGVRFKRPFLAGRGAAATAALCRNLEIRTLISIGQRAEVDEAVFRASGIEVIQTGYLAADLVSSQLGSARIALVDYFTGSYAKSGVLAAAAAHGAPPIFPRRGIATDGLRFGEQLWDLQSALAANCEDVGARLSSISQAARAWYDTHSLERHASLLAEICGFRTAAVE